MKTTTSELAEKEFRSPILGQRTLHIVTLCGFAITQPVLVALMKQTVYLHDEGIGWREVGALLTVLTLILPSLAVALDRLLLQISRKFRGFGRNTVFTGLIAMILLSLVRPALGIEWVIPIGFAGLVALIVVIPCSWLLANLYERQGWLKTWMTFASIGLLIFPCTFLWQFGALQTVETRMNTALPVANKVPVILVVFDEMSGITLMDENMELDVRRFPHFGRLGQRSTWYPNATTVHPRTQAAVPAILSGRYPMQELSPLESQYPGNLLQVINATKAFDMAVFEAATRLCPPSVGRISVADRSCLEKSADLIQTLAAVYPRLIFSRDVPLWLPPIPKPWFGFSRGRQDQESDPEKTTEGFFRYFSTANRTHQFRHFLKCIRSSERTRFAFYHTVFPHFPWSYLPTGEQYELESAAPKFPAGAGGELGEDWRNDSGIILRNECRYRLQVGYIDRLIGQLLDRLQETELLDECLLIVMADHGVSFRAGHSRRLPDNDTLAEIVSVPLFIKLPGQTEGRIDDRNVESVDILPTIADVLGIDLTNPVDGISVLSQNRHPRKTVYFETATTVLEPGFPQRKSAVQRQANVFGMNSLDEAPLATAVHPEWHGRSIKEFAIDSRPIHYLKIDPLKSWYFEETPDRSTLVRGFITGLIPTRNLTENPATIVVVVDGVIIDTGKTYPLDRSSHGLEFLLPRPLTEDHEVKLYMVERTANEIRLRPMMNESSYRDVYLPD